MFTNNQPPVGMYLHCRQCLAELPKGESPRTWARLEVGVASLGEVVVWCVRHDAHVATVEQQAETDRRTAPRAPHDSPATS